MMRRHHQAVSIRIQIDYSLFSGSFTNISVKRSESRTAAMAIMNGGLRSHLLI